MDLATQVQHASTLGVQASGVRVRDQGFRSRRTASAGLIRSLCPLCLCGEKTLPVGFALVALLTTCCVYGQPRLKQKESSSYRVGDRVDGESQVLDKDLAPRTFADIIKPDSKAIVLAIIGGAAPSAPDWHPLRGGLWCPDTFDDLPLHRALIRQFKDDPVQFIAVAMTPAYSDVYGFEEDVFLTRADDDPLLISQVRVFIDLTEETKGTDVMPYEDVFYDPKYRLAQDRERELGKDYGPVYDWQGKFRWHLDPRKYGTPSIWILGPDLRVVREPFIGNNYNDDPPQILYQFQDVKEAIEQLLTDDSGVSEQ